MPMLLMILGLIGYLCLNLEFRSPDVKIFLAIIGIVFLFLMYCIARTNFRLRMLENHIMAIGDTKQEKITKYLTK